MFYNVCLSYSYVLNIHFLKSPLFFLPQTNYAEIITTKAYLQSK